MVPSTGYPRPYSELYDFPHVLDIHYNLTAKWKVYRDSSLEPNSLILGYGNRTAYINIINLNKDLLK
jgi:hypothetical protein